METEQEIFERIYRYKLWGGRKTFWRRFYSGTGSFESQIVEPYLEAVPLLSGKQVVDIGVAILQLADVLRQKVTTHAILQGH